MLMNKRSCLHSGIKEGSEAKQTLEEERADAPLDDCILSRMSVITAFFSLTVDVRYSWSRSSRKRRSSTINSSIAANKGERKDTVRPSGVQTPQDKCVSFQLDWDSVPVCKASLPKPDGRRSGHHLLDKHAALPSFDAASFVSDKLQSRAANRWSRDPKARNHGVNCVLNFNVEKELAV